MSRRRQPSEFLADNPYDYPVIPRTRGWRYSEQAPDRQQSISRSLDSRQGRDVSYEDQLSAGEREFWREYDEVHGSSSGAALRIAYQQPIRRRGAVSVPGRAVQRLKTSNREVLSTTRTSAIRRNPPPSFHLFSHSSPSILFNLFAKKETRATRMRRLPPKFLSDDFPSYYTNLHSRSQHLQGMYQYLAQHRRRLDTAYLVRHPVSESRVVGRLFNRLTCSDSASPRYLIGNSLPIPSQIQLRAWTSADSSQV